MVRKFYLILSNSGSGDNFKTRQNSAREALNWWMKHLERSAGYCVESSLGINLSVL